MPKILLGDYRFFAGWIISSKLNLINGLISKYEWILEISALPGL
jgi:hypothetical protein